MIKHDAVRPSTESHEVDDSEAHSVEDTSSLAGGTQDNHAGSFSSDQEGAADSPLALIRKDNKAVSGVRSLVVLLLLFAAAGTSFFVFYFTRESERDAFETEFAAIADRMLESFLSDTALRMNQAATVAAGVTMAMRAQETNLYNLVIDAEDWRKLTNELTILGKSPLVAYSPFLRTDEQRVEFEKHASEWSGDSDSGTNKNPPCYLCGKGVPIRSPGNMFEFVGHGSFKCSDVLSASAAGFLPPDYCENAKQVFSDVCHCDPSVAPLQEDGQNTHQEDKQDQGWPVQEGVFRMQGVNGTKREYGMAPYAPLFQAMVPAVHSPPNMYDQCSEPARREAVLQSIEQSAMVYSKMVDRSQDPFYLEYGGLPDRTCIALYYPILGLDDPTPVGVTTVDVSVETYFTALFPTNSHLVVAVLRNSCDQEITVKPAMDGRSLVTLGKGDLHDTSYNSLAAGTSFQDFEAYVLGNSADLNDTPREELDYCRYLLDVYPTSEFEEFHKTNKPFTYAAITAVVFLFTTTVFAFYDVLVRKRQEKVMESAMRTQNIVAQLFPQNVRDRLYEQVDGRAAVTNAKQSRLQKFLREDDNGSDQSAIADLFPHCTIAFLDIAGFTAWSSEREPQQVFRLLENLYGSFDEIAKPLGVFKVETIGDCYVAATGLPKARKDHAVVMVRFADQCLRRMKRITHDLERFLGPSTGELEVRVGLHSGPVTAGVLRGEKARFQLFGDSMNFASRIESAGLAGRIHVSPATAQELRLQGKDHWLVERPDVVHLKGEGKVQTFWAVPRCKGQTASSYSGTGHSDSDDEKQELDGEGAGSEKVERLIDWNFEVLLQHLQPVVNSRTNKPRPSKAALVAVRNAEHNLLHDRQGIVVDEMTQILGMPEFDPDTAQAAFQDSEIPPSVKQQLREFVVMIANTYRITPFHNFDHASHFVMSAGKLMKRIVTPEHVDCDQNDVVSIAREIHESTHGISSDPLLQFTTVFSALIHDADHTGLTNAELVQMKTPVSLMYRERSVAEQNSVDVAWGMLMSEQFTDLRDCIYSSTEELYRFRQLLVNATMATDIADKEFQRLRKNRWKDAFVDDASGDVELDINPTPRDPKLEVHRKATIVLEHIMQASDVAHTMQHWHVYLKYNKRLFEERYLAWLQGVAGENDPSVGWYKGEIGFFEFYIIPLARKLDRCGVFGVSYHEYLQYAISNKAEWQDKGEAVVQEMLSECRAKYGDGTGKKSKQTCDAVQD